MLYGIITLPNAAIVAAAVAASEVSVGYDAYPQLRQVVGVAVVALAALGATRTHNDHQKQIIWCLYQNNTEYYPQLKKTFYQLYDSFLAFWRDVINV